MRAPSFGEREKKIRTSIHCTFCANQSHVGTRQSQTSVSNVTLEIVPQESWRKLTVIITPYTYSRSVSDWVDELYCISTLGSKSQFAPGVNWASKVNSRMVWMGLKSQFASGVNGPQKSNCAWCEWASKVNSHLVWMGLDLEARGVWRWKRNARTAAIKTLFPSVLVLHNSHCLSSPFCYCKLAYHHQPERACCYEIFPSYKNHPMYNILVKQHFSINEKTTIASVQHSNSIVISLR